MNRIQYLNKNVSLFVTPAKLSGMAWLEQKIWESYSHKVCADCGNKGVVKQESGLIKVVPYYWFCKKCAKYWDKKKNA